MNNSSMGTCMRYPETAGKELIVMRRHVYTYFREGKLEEAKAAFWRVLGAIELLYLTGMITKEFGDLIIAEFKEWCHVLGSTLFEETEP